MSTLFLWRSINDRCIFHLWVTFIHVVTWALSLLPKKSGLSSPLLKSQDKVTIKVSSVIWIKMTRNKIMQEGVVFSMMKASPFSTKRVEPGSLLFRKPQMCYQIEPYIAPVGNQVFCSWTSILTGKTAAASSMYGIVRSFNGETLSFPNSNEQWVWLAWFFRHRYETQP